MPFSNRVRQHLVRRWRITLGTVAACLVLLLLVILSRLNDVTLPGVLPPGAFDLSQQSRADHERSPHAAPPWRDEGVSQLFASLKTGEGRLLSDHSSLDFDVFALQTDSEQIALFDESTGVLARCESCDDLLPDETYAHTFHPEGRSIPMPGYIAGVGSRSASAGASGAADSGGSGSSGLASSGGSGALGGGSLPENEIPPPPSGSSGGSYGDGPSGDGHSQESNDSRPDDHGDGTPNGGNEFHPQGNVDQNPPTRVPEPSTVLLAVLGISGLASIGRGNRTRS